MSVSITNTKDRRVRVSVDENGAVKWLVISEECMRLRPGYTRRNRETESVVLTVEELERILTKLQTGEIKWRNWRGWNREPYAE